MQLLFKLVPIIRFLANLVIGFLGLRLILKLFGASAISPFVSWVYTTSSPLVTPFEGIFPAPDLGGGFVLELAVLFAMAIYGLLAYLLIQIVEFLTFYLRQRIR